MEPDLDYFCEEELESADDLSDAETIEEEESSDSDEDIANDVINEYDQIFYGKNKSTEWLDKPQKFSGKHHTATHARNEGTVHPNIPSHSVKAVFQMFMTEQIIEKVTVCSNRKGKQKHGDNWEDIDETELLAWIGLNIRSGINQDGFRPVSELFSSKEGPAIYSAAMSRKRFNDIKDVIRFDNIETRHERREKGKQGSLAPIKELFDMFMEACNSNYKPSQKVTIDESIVGFKGKCSFKIYMPSKPIKHGVKIWSMCDSANAYLCNAQIYQGKQFEKAEVGQGKRVVLDLTSGITGSGRNVTTDNFFTSVPLCQELHKRNLTLLGTIRRNKPEVPPSFQGSKAREVHSTKFGFAKDSKIMMASYVPKKGKSVIMLSSAHYNSSIEENPPFKPQLILDYNKSKGGVDTFDQCVKNYSSKRTTNRWPLALFYWIIDAAGYNSSICYMTKNQTIYQGSQKRRKFLFDLSEELVQPQINRRANSVEFHKLHQDTRAKINIFSQIIQ